MTKMPRKTGKPRQLEEDEANLAEDERPTLEDETLDEFLGKMHGTTTQEQKFDGMPTLTWLKSHFKTKSAIIRYLLHHKFPKAAIAKHLGIKYQHVRNVSVQELKRGPNEDFLKPVELNSESANQDS